MGLFDRLFANKKANVTAAQSGPWQTFTAYRPQWVSWNGNLYESELIRAAVDAIARHTGKLQVTFNGNAKGKLRTLMRSGPNEWQTWGQFLYRTRTILEMESTAFIVPVIDELDDITGYFTVIPKSCEIHEYQNKQFLVYHFKNGKTGAMEMELCGLLTKFQYQDDIYGTSNKALNATMELMNLQNQGITEGVKNGASFRFAAHSVNFMDPEDLAKKRKEFNKNNLRDESGGLLLFPKEFDDIRQLENKPFIIDHDQVELIQKNIYNYFGVNEDILQNKAVGDSWNAFYEGCLEPFAVQLSDVMTRMTFSQREIAAGNCVFVTANRMQYMSNTDKLNVSSQMLDRGIMNRDEIREIWNLPPLPNGEGQAYIVRGEYKNADEKINGGSSENDNGQEGNENAGE